MGEIKTGLTGTWTRPVLGLLEQSDLQTSIPGSNSLRSNCQSIRYQFIMFQVFRLVLGLLEQSELSAQYTWPISRSSNGQSINVS